MHRVDDHGWRSVVAAAPGARLNPFVARSLIRGVFESIRIQTLPLRATLSLIGSRGRGMAPRVEN